GCLARRGERGDRRQGGGVLDVTVPAVRETEELRRPVQRQRLELRRRRRGAPDEGDRVERRRKQFGENARLRCADGEVRQEAWALPVRHARQQDLVEVAKHVGERLASFGRRRRQLRASLARLNL